MPTMFDAIYLGVLPRIDTGEGNQTASQNAVNSWRGIHGGAETFSGADSVVGV